MGVCFNPITAYMAVAGTPGRKLAPIWVELSRGARVLSSEPPTTGWELMTGLV